MDLHRLIEMIESLDWADFERCHDGDLYVYDSSASDLTKFSLRVGLHLGEPSYTRGTSGI